MRDRKVISTSCYVEEKECCSVLTDDCTSHSIVFGDTAVVMDEIVIEQCAAC